jgi:tol-pal system protein YbgF
MRKTSAGAAFALILSIAAPAAAQNKREMQMMADIRMLQEQTQQLQQQMQTAISTLMDALKGINGRLDDQTNATRKAFADQKLIVDELSGNLRVIKERVDDTNVRIGSLSQEVEALRLSIPQYPAFAPPPAIDPAQPAASVPGQEVPAPITPPPPAPAAGAGVSPQRMFETSWADYTASQWELCVTGFEQYIRSFPRSEAVGDAYFYIGECSAAQKKYTEAVDAYNRVIVGYAKSARAPEAIYKRGLAFENLAQVDRARESYELLMKTYPDSDAARLAKQNIARLNRGRPL